MSHEMQLQTEEFEAINLGLKRVLFQVDACVGDCFRLFEYEPLTGFHSGRWIDVQVSHVEQVNGLTAVSIHRVADGYDVPFVRDVKGNRIRASNARAA